MLTFFPIVILFLLFTIIAALGHRDRIKIQPPTALPPLSIVVPCFNDTATVGKTIASIFDACGPGTQVIVIDDGSTDGSRRKLKRLQRRYTFKLVVNSINLGKTKTLNQHFHLAGNNIVVFVDADLMVNRKSLMDAVARLQQPCVGAVSCPYRSANPGFIPLMQTIEYNMLSFVQGAYNVFSAIALWGGFIAIKRTAFMSAGGFTSNAITEDMDLAFKLNRSGWKVQQSFHPVKTFVPCTFKHWYHQKVRWSSGGLQCLVKYHRVWIKNPMHVLFLFSFCILLTLSAANIGKDLFLWDQIIDYYLRLHSTEGLVQSLRLTLIAFADSIMRDVISRISLTLISLPFVLPLVSTLRKIHLCFMIIPFSIFYVPLLSFISFLGACCFLRKRHRLTTTTRAW